MRAVALFRALPLVAALLWPAGAAHAGIGGLVDLRAVYSDTGESWLDRGLGKQRFADENDGPQLGQAVLEARGQLADTVSGKLVLNAYTDRDSGVDVTEAWLQWKPLPVGGYRFKARAGAFFPAISLENTGPGWTSPWMLSTSAVNTWVGEELRTNGLEFSLGRPGQLHDSPHDVDLVAAVFAGNDPAGALLAWRGWSVGDRITGLTERLPLPDLPIFQPGYYSSTPQAPWEEPFREIDHRAGYYAGINYGYNGWFSLQALHYDNNGDPAIAHGGQYAWATSFDHLGMRIDLPRDWSLLSQYMTGETSMGSPTLVYADFDAWYLLVSKSHGAHRWSLRYDIFAVHDRDNTANDDNSEHGTSLALDWQYALNTRNTVGLELLDIRSVRAGREYLHNLNSEAAGTSTVTETGAQLFYRFHF